MPLEIWRCQLWRLAANLPLIFVCLLCARHSVGQEIAPDCSAADLDISYRFLNNPPNEKVIVEFRNTSQGACTLRPGPGISFGDYSHLHSIRTTDCHNCDVDGKSRSVPPITISVGQATHLIVGWETTRVGGIACQEGGTLNSYVNGDLKHGFVIWAGNLLGDVCSVVRVDSLAVENFSADSDVWSGELPCDAGLTGSPQFGEVTASSSSGPSLPYAVVHSLPVTFRVVAQRR